MQNHETKTDKSTPIGEASNPVPKESAVEFLLLEAEIRSRAYAKWEAAGCPIIDSDKEGHQFWYAAEKEILERKALETEPRDEAST